MLDRAAGRPCFVVVGAAGDNTHIATDTDTRIAAMTSPATRRWWTIAAVLLVLILIVVGVRLATRPAAAADKKARPANAGAVQVTTAPVTTQNVPIYRTGIGTVTATQTVTVKARIDASSFASASARART